MATATATIDSTLDIGTPENIAFEYQAAGILRRVPAYVIDVLLCVVAFGMVAFFLSLSGAIAAGEAGMILAAGPLMLLWFAMQWFYGGLLETFWNGQTIGKRLMGLRVLTIAGEPINGLQAVMRNILRFADSMPLIPIWAFAAVFGWNVFDPPVEGDADFPLFKLCEMISPLPTYAVAVAVSAMNRRRQRVGDLVCGTMVIVEEASWLYGVLRLQDRRVSDLAATLPVHIDVGRSTGKALAMYVERRRFFSAARRQEIAMHLGHLLIERCGLPPVSDHDLLLCAIYQKVFAAENTAEERSHDAPVFSEVVPESPRIRTTGSVLDQRRR
ncbi:MAG: RDD family protein [Planctomycetales bacterium]|nr:RDD family protein [Planctomycetales bacterium]